MTKSPLSATSSRVKTKQSCAAHACPQRPKSTPAAFSQAKGDSPSKEHRIVGRTNPTPKHVAPTTVQSRDPTANTPFPPDRSRSEQWAQAAQRCCRATVGHTWVKRHPRGQHGQQNALRAVALVVCKGAVRLWKKPNGWLTNCNSLDAGGNDLPLRVMNARTPLLLGQAPARQPNSFHYLQPTQPSRKVTQASYAGGLLRMAHESTEARRAQLQKLRQHPPQAPIRKRAGDDGVRKGYTQPLQLKEGVNSWRSPAQV